MRVNNWFKAAVFFLSISLFSCTKKANDNGTNQKIDANTVEVASLDTLKISKIQKQLFPETIEVSGKVSIPDKDIVNITARVQGRIDSLLVTIGDRVKVGQTLGTLWSSDLITAAEEYKMAITQKDQELIELSKSKLKAMALSPGDVSGNRTSFPIRSPMEGVVLDKKLNSGSAVNVGDLIVSVGKNTSHQFAAEVPPEVALKIKVGMKVRFPERETGFFATVANVSPVADPNTNLVKVRCEFNGTPSAGILQETYLKAEIVVRETESLVAPTKALLLTNEGEKVFIQDEKNPRRFIRVPVKINSRNKLQLDVAETPEIKEEKMIVGEGAILLEGILEGDE